MEKSIGQYVKDSLTLFGRDVDTKRQLPSVMDGLKPAYRRVIYEELQNGLKMQKSASIAGHCISSTHPHGDASLQDVISNLVRWGISKGQGNHGKKMLTGEDTSPSAMRYTEARISDNWYHIFNELMPYVPYVDAEISGKEPVYLPTVVPLSLVFGTMGLGLGVNCRMPAFTPESLLNAYFHDDPNLLVANFGLNIDKERSELDKLWTTGVGKVCYKYTTKWENIEGKWGFTIEGSPELFKPLMTRIDNLVQSSKVYMIDLTDGNSTKLFIAREYNVKSISNEDLSKLINEAATNIRTYRLTVADDDQCYLIPMREWIGVTVGNYIKLIETMKSDKINKLKFDRCVVESLPKVVECLMHNRDYDANKISESTSIGLDIVKAVLSRSISALRRSDSSDRLHKIDQEISRYEELTPMDKINELINEFNSSR